VVTTSTVAGGSSRHLPGVLILDGIDVYENGLPIRIKTNIVRLDVGKCVVQRRSKTGLELAMHGIENLTGD
jgi:hypothetical protein